MRPPAVTSIAVAVLLLVATPARAQDEFAAHYDRALHFYNGERYTESLAELDAAWRLRQHTELLFHMARAKARLGSAADAIADYRRFLAAEPNPDPGMKAEAEAEIARLAPLVPPRPTVQAGPGDGTRWVPVKTEMKPHRGVALAGGLVLALAYGGTFIAGVVFASVGDSCGSYYYSSCRYGSMQAGGGTLLIPVLGPFISAATYRDPAWAMSWALTSGLLQGMGFTMMVVGAVLKHKVTSIDLPEISLAPMLSPTFAGASAQIRF